MTSMVRRALSIAAPAALLAIALPAHGDGNALPQLFRVLNALSAIGPSPPLPASTPPIAGLDAQNSLSPIATDGTQDPGLRIRAIRSMATYCNQTSCTDPTSPIRSDLPQIISAYIANPNPNPSDLMVMRAAVESLGAANAVSPADVPNLLTLLGNPSRDVRATVVHTLATTCSQQVLDQVVALKKTEPTAQVRGELNLAEQAITSCVDK